MENKIYYLAVLHYYGEATRCVVSSTRVNTLLCEGYLLELLEIVKVLDIPE